jgi:AraC-like DNA-binding protein
VFQQDRFRHDRTDSSWPDDAADGTDDVEKNGNQIAHRRMLTEERIRCFAPKLSIRQGQVTANRPGAVLASTQLAQLLFVQIIRIYLAASEPLTTGWLRALNDARIAPALRLMHGEPGRAWRLSELAKQVGMSRTSFALRFKANAGVGPLTYLQNLRVSLAERGLREGAMSVSELADSLGYATDSAFSNAFKRKTGMAPKHYQSVFARMDESTSTPPAITRRRQRVRC